MPRRDAAKSIMSKRFYTVRVGKSVKAVSKLLIEKGLTGVPVTDTSGRMVGFISEKDIIASIGREGGRGKVEEVMTKEVVTVTEGSSLDDVCRIFTEYPFRCVPVVKGKKVVGVISRKNVMHKLMGEYY